MERKVYQLLTVNIALDRGHSWEMLQESRRRATKETRRVDGVRLGCLSGRGQSL